MDQSPVHNQGPVQGQNIGQYQQITQHVYPPVPAPLSQKPKRVPLEQQNRERMLRRLRRTFSDLMSQTLQGAAWLELGMAEKPDAMRNAMHVLLRIKSGAEQLLPPGTSITEVYDEAEHELLILGEPGAGKSTLLLSLSQQLLVRAEQDETHPLPVILSLSTWAVKRPKLQDWMVEQMSEIYDVPRPVSVQWVQEGSILPLLDGLDEMEETARAACIAAINTYHHGHMLPLVVCSRTVEYEAASKHHRLALQGAVVVQPLTHEEVDASLVQAGQPLTALRRALRKNTALHDLVTTPLMLNILILTYQGDSVRDLPKKEAALLQQVWDDYVERMVMRKGSSHRHPLSQTRAFLGWLARRMRGHNQPIFYIEHMQPDWLVDKRMLWKYGWLAVHLPYILVGVLVSLTPSLLFQVEWPYLSELILQGGLLGWLLGGGSATQQSLAGNKGKARGVPWRWLLQQLGLAALLGSGVGLSFWKSYNGLVAGLSFAVCCLLLLLLLRKSNTPLASVQRTPQRHPIRGKVVLNATLVGLLAGLSSASIPGPTLQFRIGVGLLFLVLGGLSGGILSILLIGKHAEVQPTDRLIWTWQSFGRSLFSKRHMRGALQITGIWLLLFSAIFYLVGVSIILGLLLGAVFGLCSWLLLGFFRAVKSTTIDDQLRMVPNQGIRRSALNALMYGLVVMLLSGLGGIFLTTLTGGLIIGLSVGLLAGLFNGGLACLRHAILRILLWHSGAIPWNYQHFLDTAAERILLRKVGGGYIFLHRLLLDHLTNELAGQRNAVPPHFVTPPALLPCGHEPRPAAHFCGVCGAAISS
jgi:hypothetical protein